MASAGDKERLLDSITDGARVEATAIIDRADREMAIADEDHAARIERAVKAESDRADELIRRMNKRNALADTVKKRRLGLAQHQQKVEEIIALAKRRMNETRTDEYADALVMWTIEAIAGLGAGDITIEIYPTDRRIIDDSIGEILTRTKEITGNDVSIQAIVDGSTNNRGVVVRDANQKRIYDNRLSMRFERFRSEILTIVQKRLFAK